MAKELETKTFPFALTKMDGAAGTFSGYLSVFDVEDSYGDTVIRTAFKRTIKNKGGKKFPFLWSHLVTEPIGGFSAKEDAHGLFIDGRLTLAVQRAQEARALMLDDVVTSLSIGFETVKEEIDSKTGKRKLLEIKLWEGSLCVFGACPGADITETKSMEPVEMKPYPNEHSCRLADPDNFSDFRRTTRKHEGKEYSVIYGKEKDGDAWDEQAYRYAKDTWTAEEARAHCKDHDGSFEAAKCAECAATLEEEPGQPTPPDIGNPDFNVHLLDGLIFKVKE
jgi:Escherichia/Staphylococcus phage prohead protease